MTTGKIIPDINVKYKDIVLRFFYWNFKFIYFISSA